MLGDEQAAIAVADFDEAARRLTELYDAWFESGNADLVGASTT
jgi:hypothetical protein